MSGKFLDMSASKSRTGLRIGDVFRDMVARRRNSVAIEFGNRSLTYGELDALSSDFARLLDYRHIGCGDRVAILSFNSIEYVAIQLAAAKLGVSVACLNWRQADEEMLHCVRLAAPRLLFYGAQFEQEAKRLCEREGLVTVGIESHSTQARSSLKIDLAPLEDAVDEEDIWSILYTSGTTGWPKGAAISHRAMIARATISLMDGGVLPERPSVVWAPMFHMSGTDSTLIALLTGGSVILFEKYDAQVLTNLVAKRELGVLPLMPATILPLIDALKSANQRPAGIGRIGSMADLIAPDQIAEITRLLNAPFRNTFGSTEAGLAPASKGLIAVGETPASLAKTQSSLCAVRLVDESGKEVADGAPGEVCVRGPSLFSGYIRANGIDDSPVASGWFATGDVMVREVDGRLSYVDRKKYLIKSGGENIYPAEIERVLLACPRIADAAVVRESSVQWGESPAAFVVRRDPALTDTEVLNLFDGALARYKVPKRVIFIDGVDMPRSITGKIQRSALEQRLARVR